MSRHVRFLFFNKAGFIANDTPFQKELLCLFSNINKLPTYLTRRQEETKQTTAAYGSSSTSPAHIAGTKKPISSSPFPAPDVYYCRQRGFFCLCEASHTA